MARHCSSWIRCTHLGTYRLCQIGSLNRRSSSRSERQTCGRVLLRVKSGCGKEVAAPRPHICARSPASHKLLRAFSLYITHKNVVSFFTGRAFRLNRCPGRPLARVCTMDGFQAALRSTFGWGSDAEAAQALGALFPGGVAQDATTCDRVLRTASVGPMRSPFAAPGPLPLPGGAPAIAGGGGAVCSSPFSAAAVPLDAAAVLGSAAAGANTAQQEPAAPPRKGRPPMEGAVYSKEYLCVKRYRERRKQLVRAACADQCAGTPACVTTDQGRAHFGCVDATAANPSKPTTQAKDLEAEVAAKLAQMHLLVATNGALQARERALTGAIAANDEELQQLGQQQGQQQQQQQQEEEEEEEEEEEAGPSSGPSGGDAVSPAPLAAGLSPRARKLLDRYVPFILEVRRTRLQPDGSVSPACHPAGDPRAGELADMVTDVMTLPAGDAFRLLGMNLETREEEEFDQEGMLRRVAGQLRLRWAGCGAGRSDGHYFADCLLQEEVRHYDPIDTLSEPKHNQPNRTGSPDLQSRILGAWTAFEAALQRLAEERRALCAQLAGVQAHLEGLPADTPGYDEYELAHAIETGISSMLRSEDHEAVVTKLAENMVRLWHRVAGCGGGQLCAEGLRAALHCWLLPGCTHRLCSDSAARPLPPSPPRSPARISSGGSFLGPSH
jgi:hypothetical protein